MRLTIEQKDKLEKLLWHYLDKRTDKLAITGWGEKTLGGLMATIENIVFDIEPTMSYPNLLRREAELYEEYKEWCEKNSCPHISADELYENEEIPLTNDQLAWVANFIERWEALMIEIQNCWEWRTPVNHKMPKKDLLT